MMAGSHAHAVFGAGRVDRPSAGPGTSVRQPTHNHARVADRLGIPPAVAQTSSRGSTSICGSEFVGQRAGTKARRSA